MFPGGFGSSLGGFPDATLATLGVEGLGMCSMMTNRMMIKKGTMRPKSSQTSISLIYDVGGSLEDTELLRVYITSMVVTATGTLVLKCSLLKNRVTYKYQVVFIAIENKMSKLYSLVLDLYNRVSHFYKKK